MDDEIPVLERIERENSADSASRAPLVAPMNGNGTLPNSSAAASSDGHVAEEQGTWRTYEEVLEMGLRMRTTDEERSKFAYDLAREHVALRSYHMFNQERTIVTPRGNFQILTEEEVRALLLRRGCPPIDRVGGVGPAPAPAQVPLPTPEPMERPIQQQQPADLPQLPPMQPMQPSPPRPSSPPPRPPRNAYSSRDSPETVGRVHQILQNAAHEVEEQNRAKEAPSASRGRKGARRGGGARSGGGGGGGGGPSRNVVHAFSPPHRRRSPSYSPESRMMPVIRAKEPEPIDGWEAAAVFESSAAPIDDRDRSPTPAEEDLFPDDPIEDPEAEQEEEEAAEGDVDMSADRTRDGSPMIEEIGAPSADETMDTSNEAANTSADAEERATTSANKPKKAVKKNSELSQLLNMDFGPKEGGRAEQILNYGARVRKTVTPVQAPPSRKILPKRNAERKKDKEEDEEEDEKDEEKDDEEGTSETPTTRSLRRKRGGAQEADKTTPIKTRRGVSKDAEQHAAASEVEKKQDTVKAVTPAATSDAPPVLTPVEGSSPEPPADPTSSAKDSTPVQAEPVRVANLFQVGANAQPPPQPAAPSSTPPTTAPRTASRPQNPMDLADRLRLQRLKPKLEQQQQQLKQDGQQHIAERQRFVQQQRQREQDEFARNFVNTPQELAARQQVMDRAKVDESRAEAAKRRYDHEQAQLAERARVEREQQQREQQQHQREREMQREREIQQEVVQRQMMMQQQQLQRQRIQIQPGFSNQLPPHLRPHQPSPPVQLQQLQQQQQMMQMQQQQVQNQQQRRRPVNQARCHILNRPAPGTQQQQQQPQQYRPAVHAQVLVAPPAPIAQVPVTVRAANMLEPVRPVLELLPEENDCLGQIPLPRGKVNYVEWTPVEYAEWAKQILSGPKGEEMSEFIIKEYHEGIMVQQFVKKPKDMAELYKLNYSQSLKLNEYATSTINRQKRQNYAIKMKEYEEQMRIYELPH